MTSKLFWYVVRPPLQDPMLRPNPLPQRVRALAENQRFPIDFRDRIHGLRGDKLLFSDQGREAMIARLATDAGQYHKHARRLFFFRQIQ